MFALLMVKTQTLHWYQIESQRQSFRWSRKEELYCFAKQRRTQWAHVSKTIWPNPGGTVRSFIAWVRGWGCWQASGACRACTPLIRPQVVSSGMKKLAAAAAAKSLQSCPTLCGPINGSPPGSPVPGILQARTLEWVAISFSSAWKWKVKVKSLSRVWLLATPWTAAYQAPPSMGFSRREYWSGVPLQFPNQASNLCPL